MVGQVVMEVEEAQEGLEVEVVVQEGMEVVVPTALATALAITVPPATALESGEEPMLSSLLFLPASQVLLVHHHYILGHLPPDHLQVLHSHPRSQHLS